MNEYVPIKKAVEKKVNNFCITNRDRIKIQYNLLYNIFTEHKETRKSYEAIVNDLLIELSRDMINYKIEL